MKPQRIIWHHSAINAKRLQFDEIDRYHKTRDFPLSSLGFYVGYHYLVEYDGTVRQAREEDEIFTAQLPTDAQSAAVATLVREIRSRWDIPVTRIEPHRLDDTTECPGAFLPDNWLIKTYLSKEKGWLFKIFYLIGVQLRMF